MEDKIEKSLTEDYLYGENMEHLIYNDFIIKELIQFSNPDNDRSIPSLVDGLKPEQRKVLFTCFTQHNKREVNVAQLSGSVAEMSAYHHEESSLMMTIINLAQNFVGSNNSNLLQPLGQFGTRMHGGKDAASPQHIFTVLSSLTRLLFPSLDDNILKFIYDDNKKVEPEWYIPIIPMVLVNGAEGIGTGWACKIPNYDVRELVNNIRRMLDGEEPNPMLPSYKNFKGLVQELGPNQYSLSGKVSVLDTTTIEISELPVGTWTQTYKEKMLEPMLNGTKKVPPLIVDYEEYHTATTVQFIIKMTEKMLAEVEAAGLHKVFNLQTPLTCNYMMLLDHTSCLRKYETVQDILQEFFELRLHYYDLRKDWLLGLLTAEASKLSNQARFILEKIEGKIVIEKKPKNALIQLLVQRGYDSDPVKLWKQAQLQEEAGKLAEEDENTNEAYYTYYLNMPMRKLKEEKKDELTEKDEIEDTSGPDFNDVLKMPILNLKEEKKDELGEQRDIKEEACEIAVEDETENTSGPDFNYLLNMSMWNLTWEENNELCKQRDIKMSELEDLKRKSPSDLWKEDLAAFIQELDRVEAKEQEDEKSTRTAKDEKGKSGSARVKKMQMQEIKKKVKCEKMEFEKAEDTKLPAERLVKKIKQEPGTEDTKGKEQVALPFKPIKMEPESTIESEPEDEVALPIVQSYNTAENQNCILQAMSKAKPVKRAANKSSDSDEFSVAKKQAKITKQRKRKTSDTNDLDLVLPKKSKSAKKTKTQEESFTIDISSNLDEEQVTTAPTARSSSDKDMHF